HRRSGNLRRAQSVLGGRRLSRFAADGRRRAVAKAQGAVPPVLYCRAGSDFGTALGLLRCPAHHLTDVAFAACLLLRRRTGPARACLWPHPALTRAEWRPAIKPARRADIAAAVPPPRQVFARHAKPNADRRGRRAPSR